MPTYNPVQSSKVFEKVATQIEQSILRGELHSGDRLPTERELSEMFQVSRTAVREAMKTLAQKGLVEMRPGRGTVVINATSRAMRQSLDLMMRVGQNPGSDNLVELREIFEPEIAARAALRATKDDIAALQEAVSIMDDALDDSARYIAADNEFHRILAKGTQNSLLLVLIDSIVDLLSEQRKHIFAVEDGPIHGQVYHKVLIEAIVNHDAEQARECMRAHLRQVRDDAEIAQKSRE